MCSLTISKTIAEQLDSIGGNGERVKNLLKNKAFGAKIDSPGLLDQPNTYLRAGFAEDLRQAGVRKERIMGHRVYFIGNHSDCNYNAFYVKLNKKGDNATDDDNAFNFHEKLRRALAGQESKTFQDPADSAQTEQRKSEDKPIWQNSEWYKEEYSG